MKAGYVGFQMCLFYKWEVTLSDVYVRVKPRGKEDIGQELPIVAGKWYMSCILWITLSSVCDGCFYIMLLVFENS